MLELSRGRRNESSRSRKRGRNNNSKGGKRPQRGLGVARLEKIILQNQTRASYISATNIDLHQDSGSRLQKEPPSSPSSTTSSSSTLDPYSSVMIGFGVLDHVVQPTLSLSSNKPHRSMRDPFGPAITPVI